MFEGEPEAEPVTRRVRVEPSGIELEAEPGETVIEAAWRLGFDWPTVCFGMGSCRACVVTVVGSDEGLAPPSSFEQSRIGSVLNFGEAEPGDNVRLACQAEVVGDVVVSKLGVREKPGGAGG